MSMDSYARTHPDGMVALSQAFGVSPSSASVWLRSLEARSDAGAFYYALPWTCVVARIVQPGLHTRPRDDGDGSCRP